MQKLLKQQGKGNTPRRAQPLTDEEINMLYRKNILGDSSPYALLNINWLNNCVHFVFVVSRNIIHCGGETSPDGQRYLELNERKTKTRTGSPIADVREVSPKIYECDGEMNPLKYYDLYVTKRPVGFSNPEDPFYLSVRTIPLEDNRSDKWFLRQKVGERKLGSIVKNMKEKGGLDKNKRLTNHSARKYLVQKLREDNGAGTDIKQISGHRNVASVNNYSLMSEKQQKSISNILSDTTGQSELAVANLPRRTSTVTAPVSHSNDSRSLTVQNDDLSPSFSSQMNMSSKISSIRRHATHQHT